MWRRRCDRDRWWARQRRSGVARSAPSTPRDVVARPPAARPRAFASPRGTRSSRRRSRATPTAGGADAGAARRPVARRGAEGRALARPRGAACRRARGAPARRPTHAFHRHGHRGLPPPRSWRAHLVAAAVAGPAPRDRAARGRTPRECGRAYCRRGMTPRSRGIERRRRHARGRAACRRSGRARRRRCRAEQRALAASGERVED